MHLTQKGIPFIVILKTFELDSVLFHRFPRGIRSIGLIPESTLTIHIVL